jgi:transglutaminase-like putative cysteine protease
MLVVAGIAGAGLSPLAASPLAATPNLSAPPALSPENPSTTSYRLRQTVRLREVPEGAKTVRLWVPIPSDSAYQRVHDLRVIEAPADWRIERQDAARGQIVYCEAPSPKGPVSVTIECIISRDAVRFPLEADIGEVDPPDARVYAGDLVTDAALMEATAEVRTMASDACRGATNLPQKAIRLLEAVAISADHYSKDKTKPTCGRGAASDCLAHGGGCCTDLHSLFIAMARSQGIPARLQFGYRLTPANENKPDADPGYRCWVEFFLPGRGWVPTDIVVADSGDAAARPSAWGTLDDRRVWLWEGRGFTLAPAQTGGPIQTMIVGYAEIDGTPVDPLPAPDGTPSKLERRITFSVLDPKAQASATSTNR